MSYRRDNGPGPIPNRWLNCPVMSDEFILNKFIAFKTPLSEKFDAQVEGHFCYPNMVFDNVKTYKKKKIGLWIDLTNTSRFYDRADVEKKNCRYVKLQCRGHGETPSPEQTRSFIEIVKDFTSENPLEIIGVHCTHGFNRTGFLIASYLVEQHDVSVGAAIQMFAQARPPGIYKQDYIIELYKRYEDEDDATTAPPLPEWCFDEEETPDEYHGNSSQPSSSAYTLPSSHPNNRKRRTKEEEPEPEDEKNGEAEEIEEAPGESSAPSKKKRRQENIRLDAVFMDGVTGVELMTDRAKVNALQQVIQDMCHWKKGGFPGAQPVSMDRQNIKLLQAKPYKVSWKADGTRYMMLIHQEQEVYFFDRDNSCFKIDGLKFPLNKDLTKHVKNTLLDGEMVIDKVNGQRVPRYLVYDIICYENEDFSKKSFEDRLTAIKHYIISSRHEAMRRGIINRNHEAFSVRAKDFWDVIHAGALLGPKFAQQLSHEPDGLIFQPKLEPYIGGRCDDVLKWKPADQNSVDFQLKIAQDSGVGILPTKRAWLFVGSMTTPFAEMKYAKNIKDLHNKIVECKFENNNWVFMRERTDKSYPNAYTTAVAVCDSIAKPVTKENLLEFIEKCRFRDDSDHMPPPHRH